MDVFISHFWYIAGIFALGIVIGAKYKEQILGFFSTLFSKAKLFFKRS